MRICDWSSAVCSSDLAEHDAGVAAAWTAKDADGNGQLSTEEAGMKAGTHWTAADSDGDGQLSQSEFTAMKAADRKSEVSGLSVSVRVDLVCRRIVRKQEHDRHHEIRQSYIRNH